MITIHKASDSDKIHITNFDGSYRPLVLASVSSKDKAKAAASIKKLLNAAATLPTDESSKSSCETFGMPFDQNVMTDLESHDVMLRLSGDGITDGGLFHWIKHKAYEVETSIGSSKNLWGLTTFFAQVDGIYHAIITIGDTVYKALLNTDAEHVFDNIRDDINKWAHLPATENSVGAVYRKSSTMRGSHSPHSNWAPYHTRNNCSSETTYKVPTNDVFEKIMFKSGDLKDTLKGIQTHTGTDYPEPIRYRR